MSELDRRRFLAWSWAAGITAIVAPRALAQDKKAVSTAAIAQAETLTGLTFTDDERKLMEKGVGEHLENYRKLREIPLANPVAPAFTFSPLLPGRAVPGEERAFRMSEVSIRGLPSEGRDLAYLPVTHLSALLRERAVSSEELTRLYLDRLRKADAQLELVIELTEGLALEQARRADQEIHRGRIRGPLHGIPYGLKDLFSVPGVRTTWGATPYKDQVLDTRATVVAKLEEAGAVLLGKLTVGALAWGDVWYGGTTKNPWNLEEGSSGSSAGPAAATAAGMAGFTIGTETLGSIVSPSQRCGATGLRPTFGRVSRYGGMALSWTMDKVGPICRTAEDCALVLEAIRGTDGRDASVIDASFGWDGTRDAKRLRVGYDAAAFEEESDDRAFDQAALAALREMGYDLVPVELPDLPVSDLLIILEAEAAAAFDELTRSDQDDLLVRQIDQAWPNVFRAARLIPAVEYIQANRARTLLMERFEAMMETVDVYVHPTYGGTSLGATNLTGHPAVVLPNGFRENGTPASITFTGGLFREADLLLVARAYQEKTGHHRRHPEEF